MAKNLAVKYSTDVDKRFELTSQAKAVVGNNNYDWTGVETVNVYSYPVVPASEYNPGANDVYGPCHVIEPNVQEMKVQQKPTFNFKIARLDRDMTMMTMEAGQQLTRQLNQVMVPLYDHYVFSKAANAAITRGNCDLTTKPTKENVYSLFLKAQEFMGDSMAPQEGRIAVCSYEFYNLLKQDPAFVRFGDASQKMLRLGILGEVDGVKLMRVPSSRLPSGASCIVTHPWAIAGPVKLKDYIIHDNPPGWNGWKCEGLLCYDAFVLNEKADGIYYIGGSGVTRRLQAVTSPDPATSTKTILTIMTAKDEGHSWKWASGASKILNTYGADPSSEAQWYAIDETTNGSAVTPTATSDTMITIVELNADGKVVGEGYAAINKA